MNTTSVGLSIAVHPRYLAASPSVQRPEPIRWLTTPRVVAIALATAIGTAALWSVVFILVVALIGGVSLTAILVAFVKDPLSSLGGSLGLTPVFLALTAPTMLIWALGAIGTRRAIERLRFEGPVI
jgi:hypothetical protein